jgi:porin
MVKLCTLLLFPLLLPSVLGGQETPQPDPSATLSLQVEPESSRPSRQPANSISQELDSYIKHTASVKPNPLLHGSLFDHIPDQVTDVARWLFEWESLKLGLTYTLLNQYAVDTPPGVRHNQASGRFDLSGAMPLYEGESTAGSFSLLVRGSTNIGISQQFNLSDALGSTTLINCLSGFGAASPISLNLLYYRQDFLHKRLSFYVGKIHPINTSP